MTDPMQVDPTLGQQAVALNEALADVAGATGTQPTNVVTITCLGFLGVLGLTGTSGGIYLMAQHVEAAQAMAVFALGTTVAGIFGGFLTGRASIKAAD